jgi:hypothetical protein
MTTGPGATPPRKMAKTTAREGSSGAGSDDGHDEHDLVRPRADALIESLRAFGYSVRTAIADLIDNSIAAGATEVHLHFEWRGADSYFRILDNIYPLDPLDRADRKDRPILGLGFSFPASSTAREIEYKVNPVYIEQEMAEE